MQQLTQMRTTWGTIPGRARIAIAGVAVVTLFVMFFVLRAATATSWEPVATDLTAAKAGMAQTALEEAGIPVRMSEMGNAVEVPKDMSSKAAAALMTTGIAAKGGRADCTKTFGSGGSMVAGTSAETAVKLETCQESQAANDIENIDGVEQASVDVTLREKTLFTSEAEPAKAAVTVDTGGASLSEKTVRGIQATVAARFESLSIDSVMITDETGALVSMDAAAAGDTASAMKLETEARKNAEIKRELTDIASKVVGEGNVVVTSNVELDMDKIERAVKEYEAAGEEGAQLVESQNVQSEVLAGDPAAATQGVAGTGTNVGVDPDNRTVATDGGDVTGGDDTDYAKRDDATNFANNSVEELIDVASGSVLRNRISVVVDEKVSAASAQAVKDAVQAYMGGNAEDSFSFSQAPIASARAVTGAAGSPVTAVAGYIKWALLGLGLIGLAFVLRRSLTQRTAELLAPADDLLMLDPGEFQPIPIAELEAALAAGQPSADRRARIDVQRKVEQIADAKPNDVANELRRWMHQDDGAYTRKAG